MLLPEIITKKEDKLKPGFGWKKVYCEDGNEVVLFLYIIKEGQVATKDNYGIAKSVKVLAVYDMWGYRTALKDAHSHHDRNFKYRVGRVYSPENGIWFWGTFKQAMSYWVNAEEVKDPRYTKLVERRNKR